MSAWGSLRLSGGDDNDDIRAELLLEEDENLFGRLAINASGKPQYTIPKPYISATHLIIKRSSDGKVFLRDVSTNGTFVNGHVVGRDIEKQIHDNDMISFRLKGAEKVIYKFSVVLDSSNNAVNEDKEEYSMSASCDGEGDVLTRQIAALQKENCLQEQRYVLSLAREEKSRQENALLKVEQQNLKSTILTQKTDNDELKNQIRDLEANITATNAKLMNLNNINNDKSLEIERLKQGLAIVEGQILHQSDQLDSRVRMLHDANKSLSVERTKRARAEDLCSTLRQEISEVQLREIRLEKLCQTLNSAVTDGERRLVKAKSRIASLKGTVSRLAALEVNREELVVGHMRSIESHMTQVTDLVKELTRTVAVSRGQPALVLEGMDVSEDEEEEGEGGSLRDQVTNLLDGAELPRARQIGSTSGDRAVAAAVRIGNGSGKKVMAEEDAEYLTEEEGEEDGHMIAVTQIAATPTRIHPPIASTRPSTSSAPGSGQDRKRRREESNAESTLNRLGKVVRMGAICDTLDEELNGAVGAEDAPAEPLVAARREVAEGHVASDANDKASAGNVHTLQGSDQRAAATVDPDDTQATWPVLPKSEARNFGQEQPLDDDNFVAPSGRPGRTSSLLSASGESVSSLSLGPEVQRDLDRPAGSTSQDAQPLQQLTDFSLLGE